MVKRDKHTEASHYLEIMEDTSHIRIKRLRNLMYFAAVIYYFYTTKDGFFMHKRNNTANLNIKQLLSDSGVIAFSYLLSTVIYAALRYEHLVYNHCWLLIIYGSSYIMCMFQYRMYNITTFNYYDRIISRVLLSTMYSSLCVTAVIFFAKVDYASRLLFILFSSLSMLLTLCERFLFRWLFNKEIGNGYAHVIYIGTEEVFSQYQNYLKKTSMKIRFDSVHTFEDPRVQDIDKLIEYILQLHVVEVQILYSPAKTSFDYEACLRACEEAGITCRLIMEMFDMPNSKRFVSSLGTYPILTYHSISFDSVQLFFKRVIDIFGSIAGLVLFSPILLITAIAIKLDSPGPVIFVQKRAGRRGQTFNMYKFRSMCIGAEERKTALMQQNKVKDGLMFKIDDDPRITRVGAFIRKSSIDELPQLINVLKGDMSLVGTRPPTLDEVEKYKRNHWRRISILPGITGMWQVSGRSEILSFDEVVKLDVEYIANWSLGLDFKLILKTFLTVITRRGAV